MLCLHLVIDMDSHKYSAPPRRVCVSCSARMSSVENDAHLRCATCVGHTCNMERRCEGCKDWSVEVMDKYIKHQISLLRKRECKARKRNLSRASLVSSVSDGSVHQLGMDDMQSFDFESTLRDLNDSWNQRFDEMQESFNESL